MADSKPLPQPATAAGKPVKPQQRPSSVRQSAFGHALDGSQQLDILEEQVYANSNASAKDQPIVPDQVRIIPENE